MVILVKADGEVIAVRDYDASGRMICKAPRDRDPFGFTGGLDAGNGLWKLGARFYDSGKNAFIQQDRYLGDPGDPLSLNRYVYCELDPVNFVDPTGFVPTIVLQAGAGALFGVITVLGQDIATGRWSSLATYGKAAAGGAIAFATFGAVGLIAGTATKLTTSFVVTKCIQGWLAGFIKGCFERYGVTNLTIRVGDKVEIKDGYVYINGKNTKVKLTEEQQEKILEEVEKMKKKEE